MDDSDKPVFSRIPAISDSVRAQLAADRRAPRLQTLQGFVRQGVERGAVVLIDEDGGLLAQLMGGDPAVLTDGSRVAITGVFRRDLSTTVQQGPPFQVRSAVALPVVPQGGGPTG